MSVPTNDVSLCGWRVRSAIALPELPRWNGDARAPDIEIAVTSALPLPSEMVTVPLVASSLGPVPLEIHVAPDGTTLVSATEVGQFLVSRGRSVAIKPSLPHDDAAIRLYLLGTVLAVLSYQRGLLPLHASCLLLDAESTPDAKPTAVAIAGDSGAGKSTVAAMLARDGVPILADDVCVVDLSSSNGPIVWPSVARLKLWRDTLEQLGIPLETTEQVRRGVEKYALYDVPTFHPEPAPLTAIYHIARYSEASSTAPAIVSGLDAIQLAYQCLYRTQIGVALGQEHAIARAVMTLLAQVPLFRVGHNPGIDGPHALLHVLREHRRVQGASGNARPLFPDIDQPLLGELRQ